MGQAGITTALKNQILHDKVGHAYIFTGTRGTGKTVSYTHLDVYKRQA